MTDNGVIYFLFGNKKSLFLHKVKSLNHTRNEEIFPPSLFNGNIGCL